MDDFKAQDEGLPSNVLDDILAPKQSEAVLETQPNEILAEDPMAEPETESVLESISNDDDDVDEIPSDLPEGIKKRLGRDKRKYGRQIERLNADMDAIKRQNEQLQAILLQNLQPQHQQQQTGYVTDPETGDVYESDSVEAKALQFLQKKEQVRAQKAQYQQSDERKQRINQKFDAELSKLADKYDDFEENMGSLLSDIGFRPGMSAVDHPVTAIAALSPDGAEVMRRLSKNSTLKNEFRHMNPEEQASRFLELVTNHKLSTNSKAPPPTSKAVNPPALKAPTIEDPFGSQDDVNQFMKAQIMRGR